MEFETELQMSYASSKRVFDVSYKTIPEFLQNWARKRPDNDAFVFVTPEGGRQALSWKQLYVGSRKFACSLVQLGVKPKDVVGITMRNSPEALYAMFGAMMAGGIPLNIAFTYSDGSDVIGILQKVANCSTYILDPLTRDVIWDIFKPFLKTAKQDGSAELDKVPSLKYLVVTVNPKGENLLLFDDLLSKSDDNTELPPLDPDDVAILFQTSGSTGLPKAVAHTHYAMSANGAAYVSILEMSENDKAYNDRQFGWLGGFPLNILCTGEVRVCRGPSPGNPADPLQFMLDTVEAEKCTCLSLTLPMLEIVMNNKSLDRSVWPLRLIIVGGQPMSKFYVEATGTLCRSLLNAYGSTEAFICAGNYIKTKENFVEYSCGRSFQGVELKVVNEAGQLLPVNTKGEIYVRGQGTFQGYFNDPDRTKAAKTEAGWYKTDDVGIITETGDLIVEGRKSDVIICGTINVYPSILEALFRSVPGVQQAMVVPIPHKTLFQVVCVCVTVSPGSDVTEQSLRKFCEDYHLDKDHKYTVLPAHYLIFDSFPLTTTGKTSRKELAGLAAGRLQSQQ